MGARAPPPIHVGPLEAIELDPHDTTYVAKEAI